MSPHRDDGDEDEDEDEDGYADEGRDLGTPPSSACFAIYYFDPTDSFVYSQLPQPITLAKDNVNTEGRFYVVSQEVDLSADPHPERWGDGETPVLSAPGAVVLGSVRGTPGSWTRQRSGHFSFGPVNLLYQVPIIIL